jgi:putative cell wall-binding protein/uncharacterized protein YkwD
MGTQNRINKAWRFIVIVGLALVLFTGGAVVEAGAEVGRIYGANRYETAVAVSKAGWTSTDTVVIARSSQYADALAGVPLAYKLNAPILLTSSGFLHQATAQEIQRLGAKKAIILGGHAAVSDEVEKSLQSLGLAVERVAGQNRFDTAALIAGRVAPDGAATAVIAYGYNYPDALSVAAYAAQAGYPILLTERDSLTAETMQALTTLGVNHSIIVGGTGVISEQAAQELPGVYTRVSGANRFATSTVVAGYFNSQATMMYAATGYDFADAITGAVLAAKNQSGILLLGNPVPMEVRDYLDYSTVQNITIFGGEGAVSSAVAETLAGDEFSFQGVAIGDSEQLVLNRRGLPVRKDLSEYGFEWYIYNRDYAKYLQVGIKDGKVVGLFTNTGSWLSLQGIKIGLSKNQVLKVFGQPAQDTGNELLYVHSRYYLTIFLDAHDNFTVAAVQLIERNTEHAMSGYYGQPGTRLRESYERQLLDLANAVRGRFGLTPYLWDDKVAGTARKHSEDMAANNYFSHINLQGESPFDRMKADGISFALAAENLAAGHRSAIFAHQSLMNSMAGHRDAILGDCERLGVGVAFGNENTKYRIYYTENFYTPY